MSSTEVSRGKPPRSVTVTRSSPVLLWPNCARDNTRMYAEHDMASSSNVTRPSWLMPGFRPVVRCRGTTLARSLTTQITRRAEMAREDRTRPEEEQEIGRSTDEDIMDTSAEDEDYEDEGDDEEEDVEDE